MPEETISQWKLELNEESKRALLGDMASKLGESLTINNVYLSNVALAVDISWNNIADKDYSKDEVKMTLSRILRLMGAYGENFGFLLPVIGFVHVQGDTEYIERWLGDQDWHRGDFSLILSDDNKEEHIYRFLSSASAIWAEDDRIKPLSMNNYIYRLEQEQQATPTSVQHADLLNTVISTWKEDKQVKATLKSWVERQVEHAQSLISGR